MHFFLFYLSNLPDSFGQAMGTQPVHYLLAIELKKRKPEDNFRLSFLFVQG